MNNIRLRFAPSPTGFLHIGNLRTVLFGYALAKSMGGKFILRIEDTDQKRKVEGSIESLINILDWLNFKFDEGPHIGGNYGPYIQTERLDIYQKYVKELIDKGEAYYCFCSEDRLNSMRQEQEVNKQAPHYDGYCRDLSQEEINEKLKNGEKFVIRQKIPKGEIIEVMDELRGKITFKTDDLDDQVLMKSNGIPTYQLAAIIDDHLMEISHVTRGDEWLASFPKNVLLYKSFGWEIPKFIHLPLILNKTGGKLSKRQGDVFVEDYRKKGYLPEAIINFCALLGWHPKDDQEILSLSEIIEKFGINGMGSSPAIFDLDKLDYLNGYYIRQKSSEELFTLCYPYLMEAGLINKKTDNVFIKKVIDLNKDRLKKIEDIVPLSEFLFKDTLDYDKNLLIWKDLDLDKIKNNLQEIHNLLKDVNKENWNREYLENLIFSYIKNNNKKNGDYLWPLRVSLSGEKNSPSPLEIAEVLGKEKSLNRIMFALR